MDYSINFFMMSIGVEQCPACGSGNVIEGMDGHMRCVECGHEWENL